MPMLKESCRKQIIEMNLKLLFDLTYEQFQKYDYAGGKKYIDINTPGKNWGCHQREWERREKNGETQPLYKNKCLCNTKITNQCFIINEKETDQNKRIIVIGSCCIELFLPSKMNIKCNICGKLPKNNNVYKCCKTLNICKECRKTHCELCGKKLIQKAFCKYCDLNNINLKDICILPENNNYRWKIHKDSDNDITVTLNKVTLKEYITNRIWKISNIDKISLEKLKLIDRKLNEIEAFDDISIKHESFLLDMNKILIFNIPPKYKNINFTDKKTITLNLSYISNRNNVIKILPSIVNITDCG